METTLFNQLDIADRLVLTSGYECGYVVITVLLYAFGQR